MNPDLQQLHAYPFAKLRSLFADIQANSTKMPIDLSIGEPKHSAPQVVLDALHSALPGVQHYPKTAGSEALRTCIANWLRQRFKLSHINADKQILPVNGTREALFSFAQTVVDRNRDKACVVFPNPFYQIYEGACILAGAKPYYLACTEQHHYQCDFNAVPADIWDSCQLIYVCSPNNPSGTELTLQQYQTLIKLADKHDFTIASDECYSEIYTQHAPVGLLQACAAMNRHDYARCIVFHSLSKRSNLPGLRSGFVAGDATLMQAFLLYRTYHGCAMPPPTQTASIAAWSDETHVHANRDAYKLKFSSFQTILGAAYPYTSPQAGFYIWLPSPCNDQLFTQMLYAEENVTVLPGSFLSRETNGFNPGQDHVRIALVASLEECTTAAKRIVNCMQRHKWIDTSL